MLVMVCRRYADSDGIHLLREALLCTIWLRSPPNEAAVSSGCGAAGAGEGDSPVNLQDGHGKKVTGGGS